MLERRILAYVLAGGEGRRLRPLTRNRAKPALELARGQRIVDFVLANLANSGVRWIYVLAQYKPASLIEHVSRKWGPALARRGATLIPVLPRSRYAGTAHAVERNLDALARHEPDLVAVFAADHVYRMDVRQMADFHLERAADVSVAAAPVPLADAHRFGVVSAKSDGRVVDFQEKPAHPLPIPGDPRHAFASLGNYLFDPIALVDLLEDCQAQGGSDFGRDLLPYAVRGGTRVYAYDFSDNRVPGVQSHEEAAYWRDVGTLEALAAARRDLEGPVPRLELANAAWPLRPDSA